MGGCFFFALQSLKLGGCLLDFLLDGAKCRTKGGRKRRANDETDNEHIGMARPRAKVIYGNHACRNRSVPLRECCIGHNRQYLLRCQPRAR